MECCIRWKKALALEHAYPKEYLLETDVYLENIRNEFSSLSETKKASAKKCADNTDVELKGK